MLLTVHNLAERYGLLPSEAMARASTFDLHILDLSARYERYKHEQSERKSGAPPAPPNLSVDEMKEIIRKTKERTRVIENN
jgi:hypothetical protein